MKHSGLIIATLAAGIGIHTLSLSSATVMGGQSVEATLKLSEDVSSGPSGGYAIALSDTSVASAPPGVTVPAGATSASFTISTRATAVNKSVTVTVAGASATLTVVAASLTKFGVSATRVARGDSIKGGVSLNGPAPERGAVITLSANSAALTIPQSVTIPAGQSTASFVITADRRAAVGPVVITATLQRTSLNEIVSVF
jgi:hypothetical protein